MELNDWPIRAQKESKLMKLRVKLIEKKSMAKKFNKTTMRRGTRSI